MTPTLTFTCSICGDPSTSICVYCTKDACANHLCERCRRCSDCCECDIPLDEHPESGPVRVIVNAGEARIDGHPATSGEAGLAPGFDEGAADIAAQDGAVREAELSHTGPETPKPEEASQHDTKPVAGQDEAVGSRDAEPAGSEQHVPPQPPDPEPEP